VWGAVAWLSPRFESGEPERPRVQVTAFVEEGVVESTIVTRGTPSYEKPREVVLATADPEGAPQTITEPPEVGRSIEEGDVLLEVWERPVIVLQGLLPLTRNLGLGDSGPDVAQLQESLSRLGYSVGEVDGRLGSTTADAIAALYGNLGFEPIGPSEDEIGQLRTAETEAESAGASLEEAKGAIDSWNKGQSGEVAVATLEVRQAKAALDEARSQQALVTFRADDAISAAEDAVSLIAACLKEPSAAQCDTLSGDPLETQLKEADDALEETKLEQEAAQLEMASAVADAESTLADAQQQLEALRGASVPAELDTGHREALANRNEADEQLKSMRARTGIKIPVSEIMFIAALPVRIDSAKAGIGMAASEATIKLSSERLMVSATVTKADAALIAPGMGASVEVDASDDLTSYSGRLEAIGGDGAATDSDADRVVVTIDPGELPGSWVGQSLLVRIPVAATDPGALSVPLGALGLDGSGRERVLVVDGEETTSVRVATGVIGGGRVEVWPIEEGGIAAGDEVLLVEAA